MWKLQSQFRRRACQMRTAAIQFIAIPPAFFRSESKKLTHRLVLTSNIAAALAFPPTYSTEYPNQAYRVRNAISCNPYHDPRPCPLSQQLRFQHALAKQGIAKLVQHAPRSISRCNLIGLK